MTSRIPPSRRDPEFAQQRVVRAVSGLVPGAGRVAGVAQPGVSAAVAAAIRGRLGGSGGTTIPDGTTVGDAYIWDGTDWQPGRICTVSTTAPSSPYLGQLFYDQDATC